MRKILRYIVGVAAVLGCIVFLLEMIVAADHFFTEKTFWSYYSGISAIAMFFYLVFGYEMSHKGGTIFESTVWRSAQDEGRISGFLAGLALSGVVDEYHAKQICRLAKEAYLLQYTRLRADKPFGYKASAYMCVDFPRYALSFMEQYARENDLPDLLEYVLRNKVAAGKLSSYPNEW